MSFYSGGADWEFCGLCFFVRINLRIKRSKVAPTHTSMIIIIIIIIRIIFKATVAGW